MNKTTHSITKPFFFTIIAGFLGLSLLFSTPHALRSPVKVLSAVNINDAAFDKSLLVYDELNLDSLSLSRPAFEYAVKGLKRLKNQGNLKNDSIISIVDFSLPSTSKRLFVIDLNNSRLLYNTFVSHGRNSGKLMATNFSNKINSFASSLGFYVTGSTYKGEHGYSLRLLGVEKGINDNAFKRGIVMHSASYVNESLIGSQGFIGRSLGCPAIAPALHKGIIGAIKNGSCLFLYSPDQKYLSKSPIIKSSPGNDA